MLTLITAWHASIQRSEKVFTALQVCLHFARKLLPQQERWQLDQFLEEWQATVPEVSLFLPTYSRSQVSSTSLDVEHSRKDIKVSEHTVRVSATVSPGCSDAQHPD